MTKLSWAKRDYAQGISNGVLYPKNSPGVVWNGLISLSENDDAETQTRYIDGVKNLARRGVGEFSGEIRCFTYPRELNANDLFDFTYKVLKPDSYELHLVFNSRFSPGEISHKTSENDPFAWRFSTLPIQIPEARPSAHLMIRVADTYSWTTQAIEDALYGSEIQTSHMPSPQGIYDIFEANSILQIIDHRDGTWTAIGPDSVVSMLDSTSFQISWPSAVYISSDTYTVHSL